MILLYQIANNQAKSQAKKLFLILSFCLFLGETAAFGQSVIPANDGTGTTIVPQGNRIDISGGQLSGDGVNLFQSFQRFGLNKNQTANFISNPNIQNILGRVVGGEPSIINGSIQVSGGNSNLFLINPAGIIFGSNSQLNVPASFTATTANSMGFGNNFLNAIGSNNYLNLTGNPSSFVFSDVTPASIVNRGNLAVKPGENITLLGGRVTNTGQVTALGGTINILSVTSPSVVRISQPGYLLSIEVSSQALNSQGENPNTSSENSSATLPELLTGKGEKVNNASDVAVNSDGSVQLTRSASQTLPPNNLRQNNSGTAQTSPQPSNTNNPNPAANTNNGASAPQTTNTSNPNPPVNDNKDDMPPQLNTANLNVTPNNTNVVMSPQPNTGNLNYLPNNIQVPPYLAAQIVKQGNNLQNALAPNIQPNFPINQQLIPRGFSVPMMNNMELLSARQIINNLPINGNIDRTSIFTSSQPNFIINQQINPNKAPTLAPNIQVIDARNLPGNPPMSAAPNITQMRARLGQNLPPGVPNIPSGVANPSANMQAIANINSMLSLDGNRAEKYADYFGNGFTNPNLGAENIRETLLKVASQTGKRSAIIYINLFSDRVELLLFSPEGSAIRKTVPEANRESIIKLATEFRAEILNPGNLNTTSYKASAQKLYSLLIAPLETDLQEQNINTLLFSLDTGLRSLPLSALYDGKQFLVEKYSLSLIPAISLTDTRYVSLQNASVLAMGAAQFDRLDPLPAVPIELSTIVDLWQGKSFLNEQFTLNNLKFQRSRNPYQIIHLATHGEFKPGAASNSFIQLWDGKLQLDQLRNLGWNNPPVELLVLSACRTALGDETTEMGFAGLAFQAGVKSALASLWYVSDEGTLALMSEFYHQLKTAPIKAEALRAAQIAMIQGQVRIENGVLWGPFVAAKRGGQNSQQAIREMAGNGDSLPYPSGTPTGNGNSLGEDSFAAQNLTHPYFWSAFTMIGSPW
ncbi:MULTISPECIES: CHAT domain-containing protein [unclassified Microcoleus]|uniref:CHAT domain-containing protein n=1 Tax=unclassified Microcoleus TaxID=2642155 RepID=UPI0025EFE74A|nr:MULTISPECIES: CHAT domain-containing protein [unclassified Microcoleus]